MRGAAARLPDDVDHGGALLVSSPNLVGLLVSATMLYNAPATLEWVTWTIRRSRL